jgi:hypothetical protein
MKEAIPMFARESEMSGPVVSWMESGGLAVKPEFVTPWGICDFAGLRFDATKIARRLQLRQLRPVSSIIRAVLLLHIPDIEARKSITLSRLIGDMQPFITEGVVRDEVARLIDDRFVVSPCRGRLQKINGWMPLHDRLVSVELKLSRIEEVMNQALNNLGFADESYVALPVEVAYRLANKPSRWSSFIEAGIGVLGVSPKECEVIVPARRVSGWTDSAIQLYCVEKFWRTRSRGS